MPQRRKPIRPPRPLSKSSSHAIGSPNAESECQAGASPYLCAIEHAKAGPSWLLPGFPFVGVCFPPIARAKAASQLALFRIAALLSRDPTPVLAFSSASPPKNNGEFAGIAVGKVLCSVIFPQKWFCSERAQDP